MRTLFLILSLLTGAHAVAEPMANIAGGEVRVPLSQYTGLLNLVNQQGRPAPADYAIGKADVTVVVSDQTRRPSARVTATFAIEVLENEWTQVPIVPPGVALTEVSINGVPIQLVQGPHGLSWNTKNAGTYKMELSYDVDPSPSESGYVLPLVAPYAAAIHLSVLLPGTGLDTAVIPAVDVQSVEQEGQTELTASVPATSSVLVSWRVPGRRPYAMTQAQYTGVLQGNAVIWRASFDVELFGGESVILPLLPHTATLTDVLVDAERSTVFEKDNKFSTVVKGQGIHQVQIRFETPVSRDEGPPSARLRIPQVPISKFELTLPGNKEVKSTPQANVIATRIDDQTRATAFIPMVEQIEFSWVEAIPENMRAHLRSNATIYHAISAEEGVLHGRATVVYEITHGETNLLELSMPTNIQVNRITAPAGGVSDWIVTNPDDAEYKKLDIFLDRSVKGEYVLQVEFERLVGMEISAPGERVEAPLMSVLNVGRQRGMVALLAGSDLALSPVVEKNVTRVGENQLPSFVRNELSMTIAHTYKYTEAPQLIIRTIAPERKQGKFDAQIDTLISIGEVALRGSASVAINVKSGSIEELALNLPMGINVLGVSGPSLRSHQILVERRHQTIKLTFTQQMQGQFRIEVNYEKIMADKQSDIGVPTVSVGDAEVEHGRVAVEALTAVEVKASTVEQLLSVDVNELPQQLVLKTTNPILLAYKYVRAQPRFNLTLQVTRHKEIDVQVAAIERAVYKTLITRDGFAVTTANFVVRNTRQQFLRLELPAQSQVWSVFVDGKSEKPAQVSTGKVGDQSSVLIKMINSASGFPVEIIYATRMDKMGFLGTISARLPEPDMIVTHTHWDVFVPTGARYHRPQTSLDVVVDGADGNPQGTFDVYSSSSLLRAAEASERQIGQSLRLTVPTKGIHFAFDKLYANQSAEDATFSIRYTSIEGNRIALFSSLIGTVLVWLGILGLGSHQIKMSRRASAVSVAIGAGTLIIAIGAMGTSPLLASGTTLLIVLSLGVWSAAKNIREWRQRKAHL
ncbi:MAG: hypothetical protein OEU36_04465 [Gammaproteobacteria bacterium]|nr:hypothetical protein [Gammaproteobacteria bacterium]